MGVRTKTLIIVLLVGTIIGVVILQSNNTALFKGQLELDKGKENEPVVREAVSLPDLRADMEIIPPSTKDADLSANITIENLGPGTITGDKPFEYKIFLNDQEIFSNIDSYTYMEPKDSFSFIYPISKLIYKYPDKGTAKVIVDSKNAIKEANEDNNEKSIRYSF